ncbi:MAG: DUF1501 domain-containing protein [Xanthomonadaceae bacterium]|nr:DUF1501 domain-containing protein [Xanthomonadaceae bacterium]
MHTPSLDRREFLKGCGASVAIGALGPSLLFSQDAQAAVNSYDTVVMVFLRGGYDGLNLVTPIEGNDRAFYEEARPTLRIPATGTDAALPLTLASGASTGFGLHPSAVGLHDIWNAGKLAIVQSCGLQTVVTRSHFDAQAYLDLGTPGNLNASSGWMTRAWDTQQVGGTSMPMLAVASRQPNNMRGSTQTLSMPSPSDFSLNTGASQWYAYRTGMPVGTKGVTETMASLWAGQTGVEIAGTRADGSMRLIAQQGYTTTLPTTPVLWPTTTFARQLWTVAQSIRFNLGLRYAALDVGGWDTHENQGTVGNSTYSNRIAELSQALAAFYNELNATGEMGRVTVIVQSEFGRRVRQNGSGGTDHGYGSPLLVLGGPVNGRKLYGQWLGLDPVVLAPYFGDVPVTTDFRRVFSELMIRRMGNNKLSQIFPGYTGYTPLGIFQGTDLTPQYIDTPEQGRVGAYLRSDPQPVYGESLRETPQAQRARAREEDSWIRRLLAVFGLS